MPADMAKLAQTKERIISTLKIRGPSLPVQVAKALSLQPLFASAFLSELISEKRVKTSNMKVGSSPLYLLPGQESHLENFSHHLNEREKEALEKLQEKKILQDEEQTPVIRVALRAIKDFAIPFKVRLNGESKLFWKYFSLPEEDLGSLIEKNLQPLQSSTLKETKEIPEEKSKEEALEIPKKEEPEEKKIELKQEQEPKKEKPKIKKTIQEENYFSKNLKAFLEAKDLELLETLSDKKKEFIGKVRIDIPFGKQEYHLTAKDKKRLTDNDFLLALQKAQAEKLPSLFISPGEPNKKALEYLKEWKNLLKFEKIPQ